MASTLSAKHQLSINNQTTLLGSSSHGISALGGTLQTDSLCRVVSSPTTRISRTPTPLSGLENLPTPIPKPVARAIIENPL